MEQDVKPVAAAAKPTPAPSSIAWAPLLISLLALSGAGFTAYKLSQLPQTQQSNISNQQLDQKVSVELDAVQASLTSLQQQQSDLSGQSRNQEQQLTQTINDLKSLKQEMGQDNAKWRLHETEHLLNLAVLNQQFNRDRSQTLTLLTLADQRLQQVANPDLAPVRQALHESMALLKAQNAVDRTGVLAKLAAATKLAYNLPIPTLKQQLANATTAKESQKNLSWREGLQNSWQALQKIVVIKRVGQETNTIVGPDQYALAIRTIALQIQQAQWAMVSGDQALFSNSLQQAQDTIARNFEVNNTTTQTLQTMLQEVANTPFNTKPTPQINEALQLLHQRLTKPAGKTS